MSDSSKPEIVINPNICFGHPYLKRTTRPVFAVAMYFLGGDTVKDLAEDLSLTEEEVEAAVRYYVKQKEDQLVDLVEESMWETEKNDDCCDGQFLLMGGKIHEYDCLVSRSWRVLRFRLGDPIYCGSPDEDG